MSFRKEKRGNYFAIFWGINLLLLILIVVLIFFKIYRPKIYINCEYNSKPEKLIEYKELRGKEDICIFVFNELPTIRDMEIIEKINLKFSDRINVFALFSKRFSINQRFNFPYLFIKNRVVCKNKPEHRNFFILLRESRVIHFSSIYALPELIILIEKNINPNFEYPKIFEKPDVLKERIISRLKKGKLNLMNLFSGKIERIDRFKRKRIMILHTDCSSCEISRIFDKIGNNSKEQIIIFSFLQNRSEILEKLRSLKVSNLYLDYFDEFKLAFTIPKKDFIFEIEEVE